MSKVSIVRISFVISFLITCSSSYAQDLQFVQVASTTNASVSDFTKSLNLGIELAFERINKSGSVKVGKLRLTLVDDQFSSKKAVEIVAKLAGDKNVLGLIGCVGTAALSDLTKLKVLQTASLATIGPYTGVADLLREPNVFPVRATYEAELDKVFQQAASLNQKKLAIVWWQAGVGPVLSKSATGIAQKRSVSIAANVGYELSADKAILASNIEKAVKSVNQVKPDAVLLVSSGDAAYQSVRAVRETLGMQMPIYAISALGWRDVIHHVGIEQARGIMISQAVPFPYSGVKTPLVRDYLEDMASAKRDPDYASLEGYLAGRVVELAILKATKPITRTTFLQALNSLGKIESGEFMIDYSSDKRISMKSAEITMISSLGRLVR